MTVAEYPRSYGEALLARPVSAAAMALIITAVAVSSGTNESMYPFGTAVLTIGIVLLLAAGVHTAVLWRNEPERLRARSIANYVIVVLTLTIPPLVFGLIFGSSPAVYAVLIVPLVIWNGYSRRFEEHSRAAFWISLSAALVMVVAVCATSPNFTAGFSFAIQGGVVSLVALGVLALVSSLVGQPMEEIGLSHED